MNKDEKNIETKNYCELLKTNINRQCKITRDKTSNSKECEYRQQTKKCYVLSTKANNKKSKVESKSTFKDNISTTEFNSKHKKNITLEMIEDYRNIRNDSNVDINIIDINDLHKNLQKQSEYIKENLNIGLFWIYKMGINISNGFIIPDDFYRNE